MRMQHKTSYTYADKVLMTQVEPAIRHRVESICDRFRHNPKQLTRLWNWIDCQEEPEPLWAIMTRMVPWAFRNPVNPNTMEFTYTR